MKSSWTQISLVAGAAAIVAGTAVLALREPAAPQVKYITIGGETLTTADLRGKVVMINFWATDCAPCIAEMPRIVETYNRYHARGFETIAVAMSYDPPNRVLDYAEKNRLPFRVALDLSGELGRGFDVQFTPTTFIIDKRGNIVKQYLGEPDFARLRTFLESKISETS